MTSPDRRATRRFIAGAVCPQCRATDRIVLEEEAQTDAEPVRRRRCVSCGYTDTMVTGAVSEPPARFSRRTGADEPVSAVRIIDPKTPR